MLVEAQELRDLDRLWDGHVVLHRVQPSEYQVEDADGVPQLAGKLLDHHRKADT